MSAGKSDKSIRWLKSAAVFAILFGLFSIMSGGAVLASGEAAETGAFPDFLLWSTFLGGFAYAVAGFGLWFRQRWAAFLAMAITAMTAVVLAAYGLRMAQGAPTDLGTLEALAFRLGAWLIIAGLAYRWIGRRATQS